MKKIQTFVVLLLVAAMLFSLTACTKGPDVTGKYICVGESYYGGEYSEPFSESWVELKKGGKGVYYSSYEFKMKWELDGEAFQATVTFLGMEEAMEGTLIDGVLEVKYGDMNMKFVKEGVEPPADNGGPAAEPDSEPTDNPGGTAQGSGEKTGINDGVVTASTLLDAFAGGGSPLGAAGDPDTAPDTAGSSSRTIMKPDKIENPSTWYGYVRAADCWGLDQDEILREAWGYVDTSGKPFFEIYQVGEDGESTLFLSMYVTLEDNGTTMVPDIGYEDAWLMDVYLEPEDKDDFTFLLFDDGSIAAGAEYISPTGNYGYFVTMRFRPDGSLWDENADLLPPGYADYKAGLMEYDPGAAEPAEPASLESSSEYGKSVPGADGIVDFATLKAAFSWTREQTSYENGYGENLTYEMLWEELGSVHGMKTHEENWRPDYHVYKWLTADNDYLLVSFKVDESGRETWNSSSWSSSLND